MGNKPDQTAPQPDDTGERERLSPSAFMRELRPEYSSDTAVRTDYELHPELLEYHLDTITNRNQTHEFEIFCRKLCERVVCPNLRPQTGPEGGGDSKADSETYPVADEVSRLTYVGAPNAGAERWAFAFSAKAKWAEKIRNDVKHLADTKRAYDRVICVTSRFARAKQRAALEDSLRAQYGIPVTIHDRSWIVTQVIEHNHKDLAFNYLHVGRELRTNHRLGPTDHSRSSHLADIEKALSDPSAFAGMETQRVTGALLAAKLSRGLELPSTETDGRFARAVRLADQDGTHRQKLETRYETIWNGFWWYDDIAQLNASYDQFEALLRDDEHLKNVEFLANLAQLLFNSVLHNHLSLDDSKLLHRVGRLRARLETITKDKDRPNASLEAETALLIIDMNMGIVFGDKKRLTELWPRFSDILSRAKSLGEFEAERFVTLIEIAGNVGGDDPAYASLIEALADFVSDRRSEVEGARILIRRAKQLGFDQHFEMIRLLGRATRQLSKKECADELIDALHSWRWPTAALGFIGRRERPA